MSRLSTLALVLGAACALPALSVSAAWADGCYSCGSGSADACKDYCRYAGQDTFAARSRCEKNGCKVSGPVSCPTATTYKVCLAPPVSGPPGTVWAAIPWCVAASHS